MYVAVYFLYYSHVTNRHAFTTLTSTLAMKKNAIHLSYNLALLFILPVIFIVAYASLYFQPSILIYQHLSAIALFIFSILSVKLLIHHYVRHAKLSLFVGSFLYSSFIFSLILYYALVFISINSWGKVITKEFIVSYLGQLEHLLDAFNISYHLVIVIFIAAFTAIAIGSYYFLKRFHWLPTAQSNRTWLIGTFIISLCLLFLFYTFLYVTTHDENSKEPLKLTLFSGKTQPIRSHDAKLGRATDTQLNTRENITRQHYITATGAQQKNLIVIMVDGLRPDHMSVYGYARETTPYLKQLSRQDSAHIFSNMRSVCGETTCAHAGFMASRFVQDLPDNMFTLQEVLKRHQYTSRFIISGDHNNFNNIREVYGNVDDYFDGSMAKGYYFNDDSVVINRTKSLSEWDGKPFMLHYHLLSAHIMGKKFPAYQKFMPQRRYSSMSDISKQAEYFNHYDNGVLQADAIIQELIHILGQKNYLKNTLLVITSDHGEALGEHGVFTHTNNVIEEILRIPLLMISFGYPSTLPRQSDHFMSIIDLAPTILQELGYKTPESWQGNPADIALTRSFTFFEMSAYKGLYDHRDNSTLWKYWRNFHTGEEFVYDMTRDATEQKNLVWSTNKTLLNEWRSAIGVKNNS